MNPVVSIKDNALLNISEIRQALISGPFNSVVVDGVTYPNILPIEPGPSLIADQVIEVIESEMRSKISVNYIFARGMPLNHGSPHKVHTDKSMGEYSAHIYLNDEFTYYGSGGFTTFYKHKRFGFEEIDGLILHPDDYTSLEEWTEYLSVSCNYNRLLIHKSSYFHAAQPFEGFGDKKENMRLVLTTFFDVLRSS